MESSVKDPMEFRPAVVDRLQEELNTLFQEFEFPERYQRSESRNIIILQPEVSASEAAENSNRLVSAYSRTLPGRIFLVEFTPDGELSVEISTRCNYQDDEQFICSEVIRLRADASSYSQVASVIRSNLLTAAPIDLLIQEPRVPSSILSVFVEMSERITFDSRLFGEHLDRLSKFSTSHKALVDLNWIRLGVWRQQIKQAFDKGNASSYLDRLRTVSLQYCPDSGCEVDALLLAGWIMDRLLLEVESFGQDGFRCLSEKGALVVLKFDARGDVPGVSDLLFEFDVEGKDTKKGKVHLYRAPEQKSNLSLDMSLEQAFHITVPLPAEHWIETLERYHSVGESTEHYLHGLRRFVELHSLRRGFMG